MSDRIETGKSPKTIVMTEKDFSVLSDLMADPDIEKKNDTTGNRND